MCDLEMVVLMTPLVFSLVVDLSADRVPWIVRQSAAHMNRATCTSRFNHTVLVYCGLRNDLSRFITRRVIILAAIGASFYICQFISNLLRGNYTYNSGREGADDATSLWTAISSLLIELSIPACGYCGALYSNRQLTCCFCSCNLFITIVSIMSFIRLNIHIGEIDGQCERERNAQQRRTCEIWVSDGTEKYMMLVSIVVIICIGCLAFWFGNTLYNRLAQDFTLTSPLSAPLVGEVIPLSSLSEAAGASPTATATTAATAATAASTGGSSAAARRSPDVSARAVRRPPTIPALDRPAISNNIVGSPGGVGGAPASSVITVSPATQTATTAGDAPDAERSGADADNLVRDGTVAASSSPARSTNGDATRSTTSVDGAI